VLSPDGARVLRASRACPASDATLCAIDAAEELLALGSASLY